eukprot:jgi/Chrzof1/2658/Cz11g24060.t1
MSAQTVSSNGAVAQALKQVVQRVNDAAQRSRGIQQPRIVAVSKTKPVEAIKKAYDAGHRVFGENYVKELLEKAPNLPSDIRWHFIGHLQSNKVKALLDGVPNLAMVETVDSKKLADKLNSAVQAVEPAHSHPLPIMIQINTSGEETKHGVEPSECVDLAKHIHECCKNLRLAGLMTIGMPDYTSVPENFRCLVDCRSAVCQALHLQPEDLELSMGMSGDFEAAIEAGSTNIRIGSTIFGARDYTKDT